MRERIVRGRFERVRERVAEVELRALAAVVRVAQAQRGLECGGAADLLAGRQLPDRLARQKAGLDDLGPPVRDLLLGERLQREGVDHRPDGPVEGADEVLPVGEVDGGLAPDRRVDLADERRRHGDPVDPAEVRGRSEAGDVRRAAAAERDEGARPLEAQRMPERLQRLDRLRLLPGRELVDGAGACAERELDVHAVDPRHPRVADDLDLALGRNELAEALQHAGLDVDATGSEDGAVEIRCPRVRCIVVERLPLVVQRSECRFVLRERPLSGNAPPCLLGVDLDQDRQCAIPQCLPDLVGADCAAAERDHGRRRRAQRLERVFRLAQPERSLAARLEDPRDRLLALDLAVDVDERPPQLFRERGPQRGLPRAHEADQRNVTV